MKELLDQFDKAFENKVRLGIMSALMINKEVSFNDLKSLLGVTDGNLASHLKYLEERQYVQFEKRFIQRKTNTAYRKTETGARAFNKHLSALEKLIQ